MTNTPSAYINRELSWLEFNQRVLDESRDGQVPLLERLKFLAITASNLDEFFMVRVGGVKLLAEQENAAQDPAGMKPDEQIAAILLRTGQMVQDQYECFAELETALAAEGLRRLVADDLSARQFEELRRIFDEEIYAVLTPMAVGVADEFPLLVNQTLNVCVQLAPRSPSDTGKSEEDDPFRYAVIPLGSTTRRFLTLPADGRYAYTLLEDVVQQFVNQFFPGEEVLQCATFRITRNADLGVREDLAGDLLVGMEKVLDARKQSRCVRLELSSSAGGELRGFLQRTLGVADADVVEIAGPLDLSGFMQLTGVRGCEHLTYESWPPCPSPDVDPAASMFEVIAQHDVLLMHPYESFDPVVRLVEEAADDPDVLAIKQVLYRTSRKSPIVKALRRAAGQGKYVTAIIELKARFDEARNIQWAKNLEREGVQVIYGVKGLKTHAKVCIVVRREPHGIQRYVHFGTGNYNEVTARLYSDVSLMTCNEELGADATSFFNSVTGYSQPQQFRKIAAAPFNLREKLLEMIHVETQRRQQGHKARITAKLNSLVDPEIINALYEASRAGVQIKLNIRGICCLRPGVAGLSENISVISIVDRFLEHARILYFYHGGDERVFISSADWMTRNLNRRVELLVPVEDEAARRRLIEILNCCFQDNVKASVLQPDGSYQRVRSDGQQLAQRSQEVLYRLACEAVADAAQSKRTVLEPHRAPAAEH